MIRMMQLAIRHELLSRWKIQLGFQPDWQPYENEYRHIEFGSRVFELRSPKPFRLGEVCMLDHYHEAVVERVIPETVWVVDPNTGEPIRRERTLLAPVSDVDERELPMLAERLLETGEEPFTLDDGSQLRLRWMSRYRLVIRPEITPNWKLVRVREGDYTPFYAHEPIPVVRDWPERHFKLTVLEAGTLDNNHQKSQWRVTYALWPVTE